MFKITYYIKKKANISSEEFKNYWLGEHAALQKAYLEKIGVRRYQKCEILPEHPVGLASVEAYQTGPIHYDFVDHLHFNDIETLKTGSQLDEVKAAMQKLFESENQYVDVAQSNISMTHDIAQFYTHDAEEVHAKPGSEYVHIHYVVRKYSHLSRQGAQLHWNACHGAVSRQDIKYSVQKKYVQAHVIDSTFVDFISNLRGYEVCDDLIGHAEGWISTQQVAPDFPADECAEVVAMSMDDIDLFADKDRGRLFVTQDHYIIDKQIIVRPMPAFFGAVY